MHPLRQTLRKSNILGPLQLHQLKVRHGQQFQCIIPLGLFIFHLRYWVVMITFDYIRSTVLVINILLSAFRHQRLLICGFQKDGIISERVAKIDSSDTFGTENSQSLIPISFVLLFHL